MRSERICANCGEPVGPVVDVAWGGWAVEDGFGFVEPVRVRVRPKPLSVAVALIRAEGKFVKPATLYDLIYGALPYADGPHDDVIQAHVWRLRKTIREAGAGEFVDSLWGRGYRAIQTQTKETVA